MKIGNAIVWLFWLLPAPLLAQPQIGGGTCSTASLNGMYSLTLTGRDVSSAVTFSKTLQGVGTASFDGLSKVTFSLTDNTNQTPGSALTLSGTYSLQSNCVGTVSITTGDTATFSIESYNTGKNFLLTGQDGVYSYLGNGGFLPASCTAALLTGTYAFSGNGFALSSGNVNGVSNISGLLNFDGKSAVTGTWYVSANGATTTVTTTGQFTVATGCTATATVADPSGNTYNLQIVINSSAGSTFNLVWSNPLQMFSGSGRTI